MLSLKWSRLCTSMMSSLIFLSACATHDTATNTLTADTLITNGLVFISDTQSLEAKDVAICGDKICGVFAASTITVNAKQVIDAQGAIVSPGFIDPHTHSMDDLLSKDKHTNLNYLTQGVTTVINGNDGGGPVAIAEVANKLIENGIGTNVALYVGHNSLRQAVMGLAKRPATADEISQMQQLLARSLDEGAIGFSTGLYYVPGNYAMTSEVIALAKIAHQHGGIYDTHIRDESSFNVGFIAALEEAIAIAEQSGIHLHLAHIKALGIDVWGQSNKAIQLIEAAQARGVSISADQYPWMASGTSISSALIPQWVRADSTDAYMARLNNPKLLTQIRREIGENIRRRGGKEALLITSYINQDYVGKTLGEVASILNKTPEDTAIFMVQQSKVRLASFNMNADDVERFMVQPWVVTSSDGSNGHPRKYASFPKKLTTYVQDKRLIDLTQFLYRSSTLTANLLKLENRGAIKKGGYADIVIFKPENVSVNADFTHWNKLSSGMTYVFVNGQEVISNGQFNNVLAGQIVR